MIFCGSIRAPMPPHWPNHLVDQRVLSQFQADRVLANKAQGLVLGPYVLVDVLGTGSMGTVFKAAIEDRSAVLRRQDSSAPQHVERSPGPAAGAAVRPVFASRRWRRLSMSARPAERTISSGRWSKANRSKRSSSGKRKLPANVTAQVGWQIANALNVCHQNGIFHGLLEAVERHDRRQ